jgi:Na+/proline symporter
MQPIMTGREALVHLLIFTAAMFIATRRWGARVGRKDVPGFMVLNRSVGWILGGLSVTASWTWALALMVSVQMAYDQGFAGAFWFTFPNILAIFMYSWLGPIIRREAPLLKEGYSLPEWVQFKYQNKYVTWIYLFVFLQYQFAAATVQIYAGAAILHTLTGISTYYLMPALLAITLLYSVISGMEASVITDAIQVLMMLIPGGVVVAATYLHSSGNLSFSGVASNGSPNPLAPQLLLTLGLVNTLALFAAGINDQQLWQRCLTIRERELPRAFVLAGITFGLIPTTFSFLGFIAAQPLNGVRLQEGIDHSLVGIAAVNHLLSPTWEIVFLYALLAGLCSTLDSSMLAVSSLWALIHRRPWSTQERPPVNLDTSRRVMIITGFVGLALSYLAEYFGLGLKYLFWFYNGVCAATLLPTLLSLTSRRMTGRAILVGAGTSLIFGFPALLIGSATQNDTLIAVVYGLIFLVNLGSFIVFRSPVKPTVEVPS